MNSPGGIHSVLHREMHVYERAPGGGAPKGSFLLLHGMQSHSGWFAPCADTLVRAGWAVLAFDRPGWGLSAPAVSADASGRPSDVSGHLESYRDLLEDVAAFAARARKKYGGVHLAGMSWGGMAALYCALRRPWLFGSVAVLAPGIAAGLWKKDGLPPGAKAKTLLSALRGDKYARVRTALRPEDFTKDPVWQDFIRNDPYGTESVTTGFCVETLKMRRFIHETAGRRLLPPALCLLAGDDRVVNNAAAARLCAKAGALVETIPGAAHTLFFDAPERTAHALLHHAETARNSAASAPAPRPCVWIVGAGAVGGATAALLSFGGAKAGVLAKASQCGALRRGGLTLRCGKAVRTAANIVLADAAAAGIVFADAPEGLPANPALVILAVKSFDTAAALETLRGKIPPSACILSLQNGVTNEETIAEAFPDHTVIAGAICAGLECPETGVVRLADDRGGFAGACFRGDPLLAHSAWKALLPRTGLECRFLTGKDAAARVKYSKLMLNIGFNALNAATGLGAAALLADPVRGAQAVRALREGFAVLRALRVRPVGLPGYPVPLLGQTVRLPAGLARRLLLRQARRTPEAAFSMRQDVLKKRQHTEIQELNGKLLTLGKQRGVPTPANAELLALL